MASSGGSGCNKRHREASSFKDDDNAEVIRCSKNRSSASIDYGKVAAEAKEEERGRYVVLSESDVRARQEADTARVAEALSIPEGSAAVLLRHFKWQVGRAQEEWLSDGRRVRDAVGLRSHHVCAICFDEHPAGRMRSAGCSHHYCDDCWRGYIRAAVGDGPACLSLRCPDPACSAAVVRGLVDAVADAGDKDQYARLELRSYVEGGGCGGRVRWCPGPGCTRAVEFLGGAGATDVFCECRHGFCWSCGEEAHRPVSCATARAWLAMNISEAETACWILANTKSCPSCRRPIEKNQGCNHMTCSAPCRHQFCWICLDPWNDHKGCSRYDHLQQQQRRRQAKASVDRYLYYYERWAANGRSLHKALADMDQLERSELERMARAVDLPAAELGFVTEAYGQIADGRRVLRWAHAYGYFLDPEHDAAKQGLFDGLQSRANRLLEQLHHWAELKRNQLFRADNGAVAANTFREYRGMVASLTGLTRSLMGNLVKAVQADLPDVAKPAFVQMVNAPTMGRQTVGVEGIIVSTAAVNVEPAAIPPIVSAPASSHFTPISNVASRGISTLQTSLSSRISQETNIKNSSVQEHGPTMNPFQQPTRPGSDGSNHLTNLLQARLLNSTLLGGAASLGPPDTGTTTTQVHMSNIISRGVISISTPSVTSAMSGPGHPTGTQQMVQRTALGSFGSNTSTVSDSSNFAASSSQPISMGMGQQAGVNSPGGMANNAAMSVPIGQHPNAQQPPPNYVKIWEGTLAEQRQGEPVFISKLESWSGISSETSTKLEALISLCRLTDDWPKTMQIVHLISQKHMSKQYLGKANFLIFRTSNQHGLFQQLQEKKQYAVIQLPSQTLLLSISDQANRSLIGMLFPGNMVLFKPQFLTQQSTMQQQILQQQLLQLQQQQKELNRQHQMMQMEYFHQLMQQVEQHNQLQRQQHLLQQEMKQVHNQEQHMREQQLQQQLQQLQQQLQQQGQKQQMLQQQVRHGLELQLQKMRQVSEQIRQVHQQIQQRKQEHHQQQHMQLADGAWED